MRTFRLEKLVHDGIGEANHNIGASTDYISLQGSELIEALRVKLDEELNELLEAKTEGEKLEEAEDMRSVLFAIRKALGFEPLDTDFMPSKTFDKGHYIKTLTVSDGEWSDYYGSNPDRFPEIT